MGGQFALSVYSTRIIRDGRPPRDPPTRPVVGGHLGINLHISEIVSDVLDPVVGCYKGGREIISTEDLLAKIEMMNDRN